MKKNINILTASLLALAALCLSGCSVGMALSGKKEADTSGIKEGVARSEVEFKIGLPITTHTLPNGFKECTYEVQAGNEPSPGRAIAHGAMDFMTLGLWELAGTSIEACTGDTYRFSITYDKEDRLVTMNKSIR